MHHAFRNPFMIEVEYLFAEMAVFDQCRTAGALPERFQ